MKQYKIKNSIGLYEYLYKDILFTHEWSVPMQDNFVEESNEILVSKVVVEKQPTTFSFFTTESSQPVYVSIIEEKENFEVKKVSYSSNRNKNKKNRR